MPCVKEDTILSNALVEMTQKRLGTTAIIDNTNHVLGIFTDGDVRRALDAGVDVHKAIIGELMTRDCKTITKNCLAAEALAIMEDSKINALLVVDDQNILIGVLNMHDLLRARVV